LQPYYHDKQQGLVFPLLPAHFFDLAPERRFRARKVAAERVWKGLQDVRRKLGLPGKLHSHTARHTLATHTVEQTGDYRLAQRFLGHTKLEMTERYIRSMLKKDLDAGAARVYDAD
jgi:site-specific recombinase XerD